MTRRVVPAGFTVALLLTGCGSTSTSVQGGSDAPRVTGAVTVNCGGSVYDPTELADAPTSVLATGRSGRRRRRRRCTRARRIAGLEGRVPVR